MALLLFGIIGCGLFIPMAALTLYSNFVVEVPSKHIAILIHKTGKDIENTDVIAPSEEYKGVQPEVKTEGRYYYNPYDWSWIIVPQVEIPNGKLGVRTRLYGKDPPAGQLIAWKKDEKGIVPDVLNPGRYPLNAHVIDRGSPGEDAPKREVPRQRDSYAEIIELFEPVTIPAGYKGVVTHLSAPVPLETNTVIVPKGSEARGVQSEALEPGTYYVNPYLTRVSTIDCRSQRYNLKDIGFPTRDGFWVSLEGIIEFRVNPAEAPKVYVLYFEERANLTIDQAIIEKVILPNARAYTRLKGSSHSGKEFITGDTRSVFQEDFQNEMVSKCKSQGIEVIQALITTIKPPEKIAEPVRRRQIALQQEAQYKKEIVQQAAERDLAVQKATVEQKKAEVAAEQEVVVVTVNAKLKQEVAVIDANKRLGVAQAKLDAAKDLSAAVMAKGKADADVIRFGNEAKAAGWRKSIDAFSGRGVEFARYVLLKKLAPAFRSMMVNTENSPLMDVFHAIEPGKGKPPEVYPADIAGDKHNDLPKSKPDPKSAGKEGDKSDESLAEKSDGKSK
jgi:regulator of protease activity HflC (stomatin/prohibitin superfamily)